MTETTPIKKFDCLPSDLVRPHQVRQGNILGIFDCGDLKMARGQLAFKQTDVTRALRAVSAAGQSVQRVEIDPEGKIVVFVGKPEQREEAEGNEWDHVR
jgi:hypothetical protein